MAAGSQSIRRTHYRLGFGNSTREGWKTFYAKNLPREWLRQENRDAVAVAKPCHTSINRGMMCVKTGAKVLQIFTRFDLPLLSGKFQVHRDRMQRLIRHDFRLMLQRQPNVVETVQKTMADELIDGEFRDESSIVAHFALFQIDNDPIIIDLLRSLHQLRSFVLAEPYRQKPILCTVVGKNIGKRR
jgi:hypothetical protein